MKKKVEFRFRGSVLQNLTISYDLKLENIISFYVDIAHSLHELTKSNTGRVAKCWGNHPGTQVPVIVSVERDYTDDNLLIVQVMSPSNVFNISSAKVDEILVESQLMGQSFSIDAIWNKGRTPTYRHFDKVLEPKKRKTVDVSMLDPDLLSKLGIPSES